MGLNPQTGELYFLELCRETGSFNIGLPWLQSPAGFNDTLGKINKLGIVQAVEIIRRLKKQSRLGNHLAPTWENNPFTLAVALKIIAETGIEAALAAEEKLRQITLLNEHFIPAFVRNPDLIAVVLEDTAQNKINLNQIQTVIKALEEEPLLQNHLPRIWSKNPRAFIYALQNIHAAGLDDDNQYRLIVLLREIGLGHIGPAWEKDPGNFQLSLSTINRDQESSVRKFFHKLGIKHIGPAWQAHLQAFTQLLARFSLLGFDDVLALFDRLGPNLAREALQKKTTALRNAFRQIIDHNLRTDILGCNWMSCLRQLDRLLAVPAMKELVEQLPAELVPGLKVEAFLLIHNADNQQQETNLESIKDYLLAEYAILSINKYRYTTGIEIEIDDKYRDTFPVKETALICALLGLTRGEDGSVTFEYAPAPLWHHQQFDPYFRLFEETGFIPTEDICSMHISAPYNKTWNKEKFESGLNDLALLTTLLYAPDRRLNHGETIRDVIRYHNTLILPAGKDPLWEKYMGRVEIRSLAFCKTDDYHRRAIKTFNPFYSCLAAFLVKRKDPIEQALSIIWQEFLNEYEQLLAPWETNRRFFHQHTLTPGAAPECLLTVKEIRNADPELRQRLEQMVNKYLPRIETLLDAADTPVAPALPLTEISTLPEQAL